VTRPPTGSGVSGSSCTSGGALPELAPSVITSRALPDVRDCASAAPSLHDVAAKPDRRHRHRKCAKVVGDVMGNYHPHGDAALYETLFGWRSRSSPAIRRGCQATGSLDGDSAAAAAYRVPPRTDQRRMLTEISRHHPVELRRHARRTGRADGFPNLLVNGATGIAVGWRRTSRPTTSVRGLHGAGKRRRRHGDDERAARQYRARPTGGQHEHATGNPRYLQDRIGTIRIPRPGRAR
jgi:hypothetical protein